MKLTTEDLKAVLKEQGFDFNMFEIRKLIKIFDQDKQEKTKSMRNKIIIKTLIIGNNCTAIGNVFGVGAFMEVFRR